MSNETAGIREQTRKLKAKATRIALEILEDPDHELYQETYLTVLKNTVPRSTEITGDDGEPIKFTMVNYADIGVQVSPPSVSGSVS